MAKLIEFSWLNQQFTKLRNEHAVILKRLDELHKEHLLIIKKLEPFRFDYKVGPVVNKKPKEKETC